MFGTVALGGVPADGRYLGVGRLRMDGDRDAGCARAQNQLDRVGRKAARDPRRRIIVTRRVGLRRRRSARSCRQIRSPTSRRVACSFGSVGRRGRTAPGRVDAEPTGHLAPALRGATRRPAWPETTTTATARRVAPMPTAPSRARRSPRSHSLATAPAARASSQRPAYPVDCPVTPACGDFACTGAAEPTTCWRAAH